MGEERPELFSVANVDAVRIDGPDDVRRAAEAFQRIVFGIANMRVAPAHDIADKRTPVDA
jgi:LuxR family transcriptional regulator, quorum-sensing system regulator CciR